MKPEGTFQRALTLIVCVIFAVAVGIWLFTGSTDQIADTNGPEDFSLATITDQDILDRSLGAVGGPAISRGTLMGSTVEFTADCFSGVAEILYDNFITPSDFTLDLTDYSRSAGNFQLVVVHEDAIVAVLEPGTFLEYRLEDVTGYVSLRIAGESAAFRFSMTEADYDAHSHD